MTVLPDWEIKHIGSEVVDPFDETYVQPASLDVRLGDTFRVFLPHRTPFVDLADPASHEHFSERKRILQDESFTLQPGQFALGRTLECFALPNDLVMRLEGKSSLARLGLIVHATGGFIDPGFKGTITLEFSNLLPVPIRMWPGQKIAQVSFMKMTGPAAVAYGAHPDRANRYQGQENATASRFTL